MYITSWFPVEANNFHTFVLSWKTNGKAPRESLPRESLYFSCLEPALNCRSGVCMYIINTHTTRCARRSRQKSGNIIRKYNDLIILIYLANFWCFLRLLFAQNLKFISMRCLQNWSNVLFVVFIVTLVWSWLNLGLAVYIRLQNDLYPSLSLKECNI